MKRLAPALAFALLALAGALFVARGRFNIDEGMHLAAGRLIVERGWLPYRDFPFSQGPGGPFLYGAAGAVFGTSLLVGRCVSLALSLAGMGALVAVAVRFGGPLAALVVLALTLVNGPALWAFTQVRTEAPALAAAGFATLAWFGRRGSLLRAAAAPCLLVWATCFRLTYVLPLVVACGVAAWELRRSPRRLAGVAALVLANACLAGWPLLVAPQQSVFHLVTSQLGRAERLGWSHLSPLARFAFFARPAEGYWAVLAASAVTLPLLAARWRARRARGLSADEPTSAAAALVAMALLSYAPLVRFEGGFFQYFVNASLLLSTAVAVALPTLLREGGRSRRLVAGGLAAALCGGAGLAFATVGSFVDPARPTVRRLAPLREQLRQLLPAGCRMLTFQTHVAMELGCDVPRGLEYSRFSYFPGLAPEEAASHGVLDRTLLLRALAAGPELVALSHDDVRLISGHAPARGPARLAAMGDRYRPFATLDLPVLPLLTDREVVQVWLRKDLWPREGR